jgi:pyridoxal phosphate enzyme (YggS family)
VQELVRRASMISEWQRRRGFEKAATTSAPRWHLIGHLQRNKAKAAVELFDLIETLDSWRLATALDGRAGAAAMTVPVLVEVNCAREQGKSGVMPEEAVDLAARIAGLEHLRLRGLMTIGPAPGDLAAQRACFRSTHALLTELRHRLGARASECRELSMGMSHSYRMAIEEGATMVRIGTALFGPRPDGPACAARP